MKNALIAANWKSNFTYKEAESWLKYFKNQEFGENEIVIFPPFIFLGEIGYLVKESNLPFLVGAQDISPFEEGSYTGEVNAKQLRDFVAFVLIGHSERRRLLNETQDQILNKINQSIMNNLKVILCVSNLGELEGVTSSENLTIAYEPLEAIGTGNPESPSSVNEFAKKIKEKVSARVIYGGSVDSQNVSSFLNEENIEGVLVGRESLDPKSFMDIIKNAN